MSSTASEPPGTGYRPTNLTETAAALRDGGRILIRGTGTGSSWAGAPANVDCVVETGGLSGLLAYNPADMTVAVRAGTPLRRLQSRLAEHDQWIALDAARVAEGASIGGLLATADAGPRQHRHGPLRDQVLGATVVLADGTIARSGGHVIKNVAGYDLAKLFSGSFGTLGLIAEVVLRTYPLPATSRTLAVSCDARQAHALAAELATRPIEPSAVCWTTAAGDGDHRPAGNDSATGRGVLLVRFEGTEDGIGPQLDRAGLAGAELLEPDAEQAAWSAEATLVRGLTGDTVLRIGALPSRFGELTDLLDGLAATHRVDVGWSAQLGVGIHTIVLRSRNRGQQDRPDLGAAAVVSALRERFAEAAITVHRRSGTIPAWGPPPPSIGLMRAVKRAFDPAGRLGPGRFFPWLDET